MTQEPLFQVPERSPADGPGHPRPEAAESDPAAVPGWLAEALEWINPAGRSAYAKLADCPRCHRPVLRGPDLQTGGVEDLVVDPSVLNSAGELEVLLAGRYTVEVEPGRYELAPRLFRRDHWMMPRKGGRRGRFVAPQHVCYTPAGSPVPWVLLFPNVPNHDESENRNVKPPF